MDSIRIERRVKILRNVMFGSYACVLLTFADKIPGIDDVNLGFNPAFGMKNSDLLYTITMMINLAYLSFTFLFVGMLFTRKKWQYIIPAAGIFLFWINVLAHCFIAFTRSSNGTSYMSITVYVAVVMSFVILLIGYFVKQKNVSVIQELENQIDRARRKLTKMNLVGKGMISQKAHEDSMELIKKASISDAPDEKKYYTRMALYCMQLLGDEMEKNKKRKNSQ